MSVNVLSIISTDHLWQPSRHAAEAAVAYVRQLDPGAVEVEAVFDDRVMLYDAGENWEGIRCPRCRADLSDDWFGEQLEAAENTGFADLSAMTPCCASAVSLNDLTFVWPVGFASFSVRVETPTRAWKTPDSPVFDATELHQIERMLGTSLRQVLARY